MSAESQQWSNPSDVMKRRKLKRKSKSICGGFPSTGLASNKNNDKTDNSSISVGLKRSNPFICNVPNKRRAVSDLAHLSNVLENGTTYLTEGTTTETNSWDSSLTLTICKPISPKETDKSLEKASSNDEPSSRLSILEDLKDETSRTPLLIRTQPLCQLQGKEYHERFSQFKDSVNSSADTGSKSSEIKENSTNAEIYDKVPIDWSLKTKLRIASIESLTWSVQMKSIDEVTGLQNFVQCKEEWQNPESSFKSCTLYWQHPNLPWTKLFPRIVSENKISRTNVIVNNEDIKKNLFSDWVESFTSIFHQLRVNNCPYFYICTHQFTVLFRAVDIGGNSTMTALLSPTTRGFREALKLEGIEFTMPVIDKKRTSLEGEMEEEEENCEKLRETVPNEHEEEGEESLDSHEGASVWLESMGLDKKQFPSLDPNKVKIQKEGYRRVDNRPESMLMIKGCEVQGLFNFLINCRSCIAVSGEQAGLPPTILSPTPFIGGTLKSNKVKHSCARQTDSQGNSYKSHVLEINGPLLPHNILNITSLLEEKLASDFSFTFNNHEPTAPFNIHTSQETPSDHQKSNNVRLRPDIKSSLYSSPKLQKNVCCIKMINKTTDGYTITV